LEQAIGKGGLNSVGVSGEADVAGHQKPGDMVVSGAVS